MASEKNLLDNLPYELTEGVIATWKGLLFSDSVEPVWLGPYEYMQHTFGLARAIQAMCHTQLIADGNSGSLWKWSNAAGRLRYREGEPWCTVNELVNELGEMYECIVTFTGEFYTDNAALSDIANMLIRGNTDAFRVLYDCIEEFGNE